MTRINVVQVPYSGTSLAVAALMSGDLAVIFPNVPVIAPQIKAGRLRGLAVTAAKRSPVLPDLPTMIEAGLPGFEVAGFLGLLAPACTSAAIVRQLSAEIARLRRDLPPDPMHQLLLLSEGHRPMGKATAPLQRLSQGLGLRDWSGDRCGTPFHD